MWPATMSRNKWPTTNGPQQMAHNKWPATMARTLDANFATIEAELHAALKTSAFTRDEFGRGNWSKFMLFEAGTYDPANCKLAPFLCTLVLRYGEVYSMVLGDVKFSSMTPGSHIPPHCGPSNSRMRLHLGIQTPENVTIRCGNVNRTWARGRAMIFDDSYEHEVKGATDQ